MIGVLQWGSGNLGSSRGFGGYSPSDLVQVTALPYSALKFPRQMRLLEVSCDESLQILKF